MKERERESERIVRRIEMIYLEWDQWRGGLRLGERFEEFLVRFLVFKTRSWC